MATCLTSGRASCSSGTFFHRRTQGRFSTAHPDISNVERGGYKSGAAEYDLLERAMALEETAALMSASWGLGQVMGFNHAAAGFAAVHEMVEAMVRDEDSQLKATANFISNNLAHPLRVDNWKGFARSYNGPAYAENQYDTRLAAFFAKYVLNPPDLRMRALQAALASSASTPARSTGCSASARAAVSRFQASRRLAVTGSIDGTAEALLLEAAFPTASV